MHRASLVAIFMLAACGSRTALDIDDVSSAGHESRDGGLPSRVDGGIDAATCANLDRPWLLFELQGEESVDVYAMRSDGTEGHPLKLAYPSPIFTSISGDGTKLLYVVFPDDADGGSLGTIVVQDLIAKTTKPVVSGDSPTYSSLSADGQTVAFTLGYDLNAVDIDGTNNRVLLQQPNDAPWGYGHPLFVGASSTILYGYGQAFGSIDADGSNNVTLVSEGDAFSEYPNPAISPDLARVAAAVECQGDSETWLRIYAFASLPAPCASGAKLALTTGISHAYNSAADPSWGPAGLIAYADGSDVYVVDSAGGAPRNMTAHLTQDSENAFDPLWAPGCAPIP